MNAERGRLGELARLFLRLGLTAFGGPAAHVGLMEDEFVHRRGWMTREEFLDLLGAANLIPGPNSTELAIHVGHRRAGWPGLLVAGACFIVPAALLTALLAAAYVRYGSLPQTAALLYGIKPVIIAIVVQALWRLARAALKTAWLAALAVAAVVGVGRGTVAQAGARARRKRRRGRTRGGTLARGGVVHHRGARARGARLPTRRCRVAAAVADPAEDSRPSASSRPRSPPARATRTTTRTCRCHPRRRTSNAHSSLAHGKQPRRPLTLIREASHRR